MLCILGVTCLAFMGSAAAEYTVATTCGDAVTVRDDGTTPSDGDVSVDGRAISCTGKCPPILCAPCVPAIVVRS